MLRAISGLRDQSSLYPGFQVRQMPQVVRKGPPPALAGCDMGAGQAPGLPSLEISQPWVELVQVPAVVQSTPYTQGQSEPPQMFQSAIEQFSTFDGCC